jgi:putative ABC transport system ATP-binding protein
MGNETSSVISLKNVEFTYANSAQKTLSIPQFEVQSGEKLFLFGASGSGKSTLLEILAGVLVPQSGEVTVLGKNLAKMSSAERDHFRAAHIGYVFQSFNLIPYLSVYENIELPLHLSPERRSRLQGQKPREMIGHLTDELGIQHLIQKRVTELSVGQQQRVAVARALLGRPEIILADEPTSALDQDHREKFIKLLFQVCEEMNTSVVFVSHDRTLEKLFSRSVSVSSLNKVAAVDERSL